MRFDIGGTGIRGPLVTVNDVSDNCDIRCDLLNVDRYMRRDGWVEEIRLNHVLGRIPPEHFIQFILDLRRKLKSGGEVIVVQSDDGDSIRKWIDGTLSFRSMRGALSSNGGLIWNQEELERDFSTLGFSVESFDAGRRLFDCTDQLFPEETEEDSGVSLRNVGIVATKLSIPRVIHQTWKTHNIPGDLFREEWVASWREMDGFEYRFWTDEDNRNLIAEDFPWFLDSYDAYDIPIKRVDAVRYFILAKFGGLYVDLDFVRLRSVEGVIKRNDLLLSCQSRDCIGNAIMGASPEHPLFERLLESLEEHAEEHVLEATGSAFLTNHVVASSYVEEVLEAELFYPYEWMDPRRQEYTDMNTEALRAAFPEALAITHWSGSWLKGMDQEINGAQK